MFGLNYPMNIYSHRFIIQDTAFADVEAEKDFDKVFNVIRQSRSMAAQYNVQSNIQRASPWLAALLSEHF